MFRLFTLDEIFIIRKNRLAYESESEDDSDEFESEDDSDGFESEDDSDED